MDFIADDCRGDGSENDYVNGCCGNGFEDDYADDYEDDCADDYADDYKNDCANDYAGWWRSSRGSIKTKYQKKDCELTNSNRLSAGDRSKFELQAEALLISNRLNSW